MATIGGPPGMDRPRRHRLTMADAGLSDSGQTVFRDVGRVFAEHSIYRLLDRRPGLDAVFVALDLMAAGRPGPRACGA